MNSVLKGRLYVSTVRRVLLHGASTWTMHVDDYRMLETFDMACVRQILKISKMRRIPSVNLRAKLGFNVPIAEEVKRERLRLFGHVSRMEPYTWLDGTVSHRWCRVLVDDFVNMEESRNVGRPIKSWFQCVRGDVNDRMGSSEFGLCHAACLARRNRSKYRSQIVYGL